MQETIFEALRESHRIQRSLMRRLMRSSADEKRSEIFRRLRIELAAHEAAEERYLYVKILMDDRGLHPSRDALADHHEMDELVEQMQGSDHVGRSWISKLEKLSEKLHEHLREEEKIFFQISGKILSETAKMRLAVQYRREYRDMHRKLENT